MAKVLLLGETWFVLSHQMVGLETITATDYTDNAHYLRNALTQAGHDFEHIPNHLVPDAAPATATEFAAYDVVILSDVSARTLQLPRAVRSESRTFASDRLVEVAAWVRGGGGLLMVGGYASFAGAHGAGRYAGTPVADVLPVIVGTDDDRVELPMGAVPDRADPHDVCTGMLPWTEPLLGYNRFIAKTEATTVMRVAQHPLLVVAAAGTGRSAAFASDCAPHWCPASAAAAPAYSTMFANLVRWLAGPRS